MTTFDIQMMRLALRHAERACERGDTPVAAVIVKQKLVLGVGENEVFSSGDCTAHAEVMALRNACKNHGANSLQDATCYTIMEPCPMCCWALIEGKIERIVLGARHHQLGRKEYGHYSLENLLELTDQKVKITTGVLSHECKIMRLKWMKATGRES